MDVKGAVMAALASGPMADLALFSKLDRAAGLELLAQVGEALLDLEAEGAIRRTKLPGNQGVWEVVR